MSLGWNPVAGEGGGFSWENSLVESFAPSAF